MKILTLILMLFCIFDTMATEDTMGKNDQNPAVYREQSLRKHIQKAMQNPNYICPCSCMAVIPLYFEHHETGILERSNGEKYRIRDIITLVGKVRDYRYDHNNVIIVTYEDEIFDMIDKNQDKIQPIENTL